VKILWSNQRWNHRAFFYLCEFLIATNLSNQLQLDNPMKLTLWILFTLLAALWTGTVLVCAELTRWLATAVTSSQTSDAINNVGQWPMPAWLSLWIDPTWIQELQATWVMVLGWLGQSGPALGGIVSWLIPLMWVVWGLIMLLMLASALVGHFLLGKFSRPANSSSTPA